MNTQHNNPANNPQFQGQIASAILKATKESDVKASDSKATQMHTILIRHDVQNRPVVFLPETYSKEANKISYWAGDKAGNVVETTADYYHTSKPAPADVVKEMTQKYSARFHAKEILVRQRLFKSGILDRDSEGKVETSEIESFKERLVKAVTKAIMEA